MAAFGMGSAPEKRGVKSPEKSHSFIHSPAVTEAQLFQLNSLSEVTGGRTDAANKLTPYHHKFQPPTLWSTRAQENEAQSLKQGEGYRGG